MLKKYAEQRLLMSMHNDVAENLPKELHQIFKHVCQLKFDEPPPYEDLKKILKELNA